MRSRRLVTCVAAALLIAVTDAGFAAASVAPGPVRPCAQPDGRVTALAVSAGTVYVGGSFTHVTDRSGVSRPRSRLAAIDTATCDVLPWTADADDDVYALAAVNGTLYAGGAFQHIGGQDRSRIAAVDALSGTVLGFAPDVNQPVHALLASSTTLYAGGAFTTADGQARSKLAAFSTGTGQLVSGWRPKAAGLVSTLALSPDQADIYAGGAFTSLNGDASRAYLGAVNAATGSTDPAFAPAAAFPILSLAADSRGVYAGGGGAGGHLVVWNLDGSLQRPVFQTDGGVQTVAVDGDSVYAGGHFVNYCVGNTGSGHPFQCAVNLLRRKVFEVSLSTGALTSWAPTLDSPRGAFTSAVDPTTHALWVGGDFTHVNGAALAHLAEFPAA